MKARKRVVGAAALLLAAIVPLTGCSGASPKASSDGTGTVAVWYLAEQSAFDKAFQKKFEADNPGITIDATEVPEDSYVTKIDTAILAHRPPDLVFVYDAKWMKAGRVLPIDDMMKSAGVDLSVFNPVPMAECKLNGKTYCVGDLGGAHMLMYNKALFDDAGVPYPSPTKPMTIDEFATLAAKLTKSNSDPNKKVYGALTGSPISGVVSPLSFFSDDGKKIQGYVDDTSTTHLFDVMAQMVKDGYSVPPAVSAVKPAADMLASGSVAMAITDVEAVAENLDAAHINWGAAPSPVEQAGDQPYVFGGTDKWGILKGGPNTPGAEKFLTYLAKHGSQIRLDSTSTPPLDSRLLSTWAGNLPGRQDVVKVLSLSKAMPVFVPYYWTQVGPLEDLYTQMANGVANSKTALKKAAPQLQTKLDRAWKTWNAIN